MDDLKTGQWIINELCNGVKAYISRTDLTLWSFVLEYTQQLQYYSLIEDLMARVIGERFGVMKKEDVGAVMGRPGEGAEGGKHLKQDGGC